VSWPALTLAAVLAATATATAAPTPTPTPKAHHRVAKHGRLAKQAPKHKGSKLVRAVPAPAPGTGAPAPGPAGATTPSPATTPTPTPAPGLPSRTRVVLNDDPFSVQSSYITLKAGTIEFNVLNAGMDDHNLTIRGSGATVFTPPGEEAQLVAALQPGTYRLYCSLLNHEDLGMWTTVTVR
jgi:plastocyanin